MILCRGWVLSVTAIGMGTLTGCTHGAPGSRSAPTSLPPADHVRILARKLQSDASGVRWEWTILGDRNWTKPAADGKGLALAGSYPLNSTTATGGTHVWQVELEATEAGGLVRVLTRLRGSDAASAEAAPVTVSANGKPLPERVTVLATEDVLLSLPARIRLVQADGRNIEVSVAR